ncbi:hypothetical protein R6Q59_013879 [Mikania micrantha]
MELRNSKVESSTFDQSQPIQKTDGDGSKILADVGNAGGGGEVMKRKRGRPPRVQANQPVAKKSKEEDEDEDVCFICFDGGSLVLCDRRGCPKAYHPSCIKRDEAFFRSKAKWNCGWHICSMCEKTAYHMCYTCTYSLCKGCIRKSDYVCVRGDKGFCTVCMKTIMLIENSGDATVDFDDKTSWEYLFKVYWVYTKRKLSLTLDELTQAKNPLKLASIEPTVLHTNAIVRRSITSELSFANLEANESKRRKTNEQTNGPPHDLSMNGPKEWASKELLDFVAHMKIGDTSVLSQFDVQALLLEYIKINNLRDPRKKTQIMCDLRLMNLFGKPRVGHIEMLKLLDSHFLVKEDPQKNTPNSTAKQGDNECKTEKAVVVGNKERRNHRKGEKRIQNKLDEYAAIDVHNMNLIYLRRNLMESLIEDNEKFHEKAVGSIVQIRISGSDQKDDMYRLVQVVGTTKVDVPYKIGDKSVDVMLEVSNLDKKETVSIDTISNQELSEDECRRLRESIRCGLVRCFTVREIQEKAMALQSVLLDDRIKAEMLRLNQLRDRASEKGQKKGVRECVKKLKILKTPEERERMLQEIPVVHSDPKMNPDYESDDTEEYFNNEHGEHLKPKFPWVSGTNTISPTKKDDLNDHPIKSVVAYVNDDSSKSNTGKDANELSGSEKPQNEADCNGSNTPKCKPEAAVSSSSSHIASDSTPSSISVMNNRFFNDDMWHYRDPSGNVQGPFSMVQLQQWSTSGYFPADMRIWADREADSLLLNNVLQDRVHNDNSQWPENAVCSSSKDDNKVVPSSTILTTSYALDNTVNLEKIPDDLNCDPPSVASLTNSTKQFGTQSMPDINQHVSSVFTVSDATLVDLPSPLQKNESHKNQKTQSTFLVQDSRIQNMPDINQHVSLGFTVADAALVDLPSPLQKNESCKNQKTQSKLLVQDSRVQNMPDINQHVSSGFTVADAALADLPSPLQKKEPHENQKIHDSGAEEQSKILGLDLGIQKMPDINQHVSSVFTVANAALVDLPNPLQKETCEYQKIQNSGAKEQAKLLVQDSDSVVQNVPDIKQHISSIFTVADAALVDLPSPLHKKENHDNSGDKDQSKALVQDLGNPPSWSTTLSLVVGGTQLPEAGDEWGRYPSSIDHQVSTTNTSINDQIAHMQSWHGLGETIEFSTLAEESVSDLLAEVDAMESRNCVPSPTSRRNSFLEELFNGSMDDFSPTTDQGPRSDGFSSAVDIHLSRQSTGSQFSFGLETKPTCAVSIPHTSDSDHIAFKWAIMDGSELHPPRQDMFDLNDSTRAEGDEGEGETMTEEKATIRTLVVPDTHSGRKSKEKEGESTKAETVGANIVRRFPVVEEEEGEFVQPEVAPPPPPPPLPLPPLLPLPRQPPLLPPSVGLDAVDSRRVGSGRQSHGTTSTGRVHAQAGGSRSGNVVREPRDSHHRRHGGDRYHSNSNSPRERSHHVEDSGYNRSSKASWSRQSSFSGGSGSSGSGYSRLPSKGQRICKFYESGRCIKGSACNYLHPQDR